MDNVVVLSDLPTWQEMVQGDETGETERDPNKQFKFKMDLDLNGKIKLWFVSDFFNHLFYSSPNRQGDIRRLRVDAIVSPTNETMSDTTGISGQILEAGGPDLAAEIFKAEHCRTGEARITRGCDLPAR